MKKRNIILAALAVILVLNAAIDSAWAYFTTYAEAEGGYTIELGDQVRVEEDFSAWVKHVSVKSDEGSEPVYVRARAFCGSEYSLIYSGGNWTPGGDGYYYYSNIVNGGETTGELLIKIDNVPEDVTDADSFDVVVVYESTPVLYQEDGTPYADWSLAVEGGGGNE